MKYKILERELLAEGLQNGTYHYGCDNSYFGHLECEHCQFYDKCDVQKETKLYDYRNALIE